jgi:hypothetical protein
MRHAEPLGQHDTRLSEPLIVGLETRQDEIELFVPHRIGEHGAHDERVG